MNEKKMNCGRKALDDMTPELQEVAEKIRCTLVKANRSILRLRYEAGLSIIELESDPARFGDQPVAQLALYLGVTTQQLYDLGRFAKTYSSEEIDKLAVRRMRSGGLMTFTHLKQLMRVEPEAARADLTERVIVESMSASDLATELAARNATAITAGRGRPIARPGSPLAGIKQMINQTRQLHSRFGVWSETVFDEIDEGEPARFGDPALLARLQEADVELKTLEDDIHQSRQRVTRNIERVERLTAQREKELDAEDAEAAAAAEHGAPLRSKKKPTRQTHPRRPSPAT